MDFRGSFRGSLATPPGGATSHASDSPFADALFSDNSMFYILAFCNGIVGALSRLVNASLATYTGSLSGSFINHVVGTAVAGGLLVAGVRTGVLQWGGLAWYYWIGGCMGVFVVAASNYAVPRIGAVLLGMLLLAAQLIASAGLDHFGLLGGSPIELSWTRVLGLAVLLAGAALTTTARSQARTGERERGDVGKRGRSEVWRVRDEEKR